MGPRGGNPANATAEIAERAFVNTVTASIIIPIFQLVLLTFLDATHELPNTNSDMLNFLYVAIIVLGILPIISTLAATAIAYALAGWPGVVGYYVISFGVSMYIGANLTGALIFFTGIILLLITTAVTMESGRGNRPPGGMYR